MTVKDSGRSMLLDRGQLSVTSEAEYSLPLFFPPEEGNSSVSEMVFNKPRQWTLGRYQKPQSKQTHVELKTQSTDWD